MIAASEVVAHLRACNPGSDCWGLVEIVECYPFWRRAEIDLVEIDPPIPCSEEKAIQYAGLTTPYPEVVLVPVGHYPQARFALSARWTLCDGNHRTYAALFRGDRTIRAFVPASVRQSEHPA